MSRNGSRPDERGDHGPGSPLPLGAFLDGAGEAHLCDRIKRAFGLAARFLRGVEARSTLRGRFPPCLPQTALGCSKTDCLSLRHPPMGRWTLYRCHQGLSMAMLPIEMPEGQDLALHLGPFFLDDRERRDASLAEAAVRRIPVLRDPTDGELALVQEWLESHLEARRMAVLLERRRQSLATAVGTPAVPGAAPLGTLVELARDLAGASGAAWLERRGDALEVAARAGSLDEELLRGITRREAEFPVRAALEAGASRVLAPKEGLPERLLVPVRGEGDGAGCLVVVGAPGRPLDGSERRLVEELAIRIGRTLAEARDGAARLHRLTHLEELHRFEEQIHGTLDAVDVVETGLDVLAETLSGPAQAMLLLGDGSSNLHLRDGDGEFRVVSHFNPDGDPGTFGAALGSGEPMALVPHPGKGARVGYFPEGSTHAVGTVVGPAQRPLGVLVAALDRPVRAGDLDVLGQVAQRLATALKNALLFEKGERQIAELSLINEMGKAVSSSLDLDDVLHYIVDMVASILEADRGSLMMLDPERGDLYVEVGFGVSEAGKRLRLPVGDGIAGYVAASQSPVLVRNVASDPRYLTQDGEVREARTLVSSPVLCKGKVLGVLNFERSLEKARAFTSDDLELLSTLASQAGIAIENARLYNDLIGVYFDTIRSLANALEAKDTYTHGHSRRVAKDSIRIARRLGLPRKQLEMIRHGALLHDIGKIGIRDTILFKAGPLDPEERRHIQSHPLLGANIISSIDFLKDVKDIVRHHHERWDGCGFPDRLKGDEIPLGARIVCIADSFDAMITSRPYREGMPIGRALAILEDEKGKQFDPRLVDVFAEVIHSMHPTLRVGDRDEGA